MAANAPFADVEIRIFAREPDGYPAEVNAEDGQGETHFLLGTLNPDILPWTPTHNIAGDRKRLSDWLFARPDARSNWDRFRGRHPQRRIRIRVDDRAAELHTIPWELLSENEQSEAGSLATQETTPFSRYLAQGSVPGRPVIRAPLRILAAISNPVDLPDYGLRRINVEEEWAALASVAEDADVEVTLFPGGKVVEATDDIAEILATLGSSCRLDDLAHELQQGHHVLHFIGHGIYDERSQEMSLLMTDEENRAKQVSAADFGRAFRGWTTNGDRQVESALRFVFLATCQSASADTASAMRSLALQLVKANVSSVLAMQDVMPVETNRAFSHAFYSQMLQHGLIDLACNQARSTVSLADLPGANQLPAEAIPVLYMRMSDGRLWDYSGFGTTDPQQKPWDQLLNAMRNDRCTPIIGPDLGRTLLGTRRVIAETWANTAAFPMADHLRRDLPQVGQYLAVKESPNSVRDKLVVHLQDRLRALYPDELAGMPINATPNELILTVSQAHKDKGPVEAYDILAHLPFPIYVTANPSGLLADRLQIAGRDPHVDFYRWQLEQSDYPTTPGLMPNYSPTVESPLVYHMFGTMEDPTSFVLTEDDYFDYLISVGRERERPAQAKNQVGAVNAALAKNLLLFLGFRLEEWAFRVLLRSIMASEGRFLGSQYQHVAVQINPETCDISDINQARDYLARFFDKRQITLYWGKAEDFLQELCEIWDCQPWGDS